jgi:arginine-tRNA-protein transferase
MPNEAFKTGLVPEDAAPLPTAGEASAPDTARARPSPAPRPVLEAPRQTYFVLRETPCPYLEGRQERKLVTELPPGDVALYSELSRAGFRRSHRFAYRPACSGCEACVPVRVPTASFRLRRSQKRIAKRNADLTLHTGAARADAEQYELFVAYLQARHGEGEMAAMSYADYRAMVEDTVLPTRLVELRDGARRLRAACIVDWLEDGPSAVYSFFDPSEPDRSLGTEIILRLIAETARRGLPYVYLGYWIAESPKMAYKARFTPMEGLTADGWRVLDLPQD